MPSPPLMFLCAAGVGLAALLYYYFAARELEAPLGAPNGRSRRRSRNGSRYELDECSICQEIVFKPSSLRTLGCGHSFHIRCIEKWQEASPYPATCPNCRQPVRSS